MRLCSVIAGVLALGVSNSAFGEAWSTYQEFFSGGNNCISNNSNKYDYTYDPNTRVFTVRNMNGLMTTITVPADGMVDKEFKSPSGNRLQVSGNVLTKELYISAPVFGCKWKTFPAKN